MVSQVFNFMWLNLDVAQPDPEDGSIRHPLPLRYLDNVRKAGAENPAAEIVLWVDSKRLTQKQMDFMGQTLEDERPNVHLKDLRTIPAYDKEPLYNEIETNPHWRNSGQTSLIWRQVDAAKILVSLQGNFEQSFFADLDHAHLAINSELVQGMLSKKGLMIGSSSSTYESIENQLWGFTPRRRSFFENYYDAALACAYNGENAWSHLVSKVDKELVKKEKASLPEFCLRISDDGTRAEQPGHNWRDGYKAAGAPALVDKGELQRVFNTRSVRAARRAAPELDVVWGPKGRKYHKTVAEAFKAVNSNERGVSSIVSKVTRVIKAGLGVG